MVRSLASRCSSKNTDVVTDTNSAELKAVQEALVVSNIAPVEVPVIADVDDTDPMNRPFSSAKFRTVLNSCEACTFPGLDGIT